MSIILIFEAFILQGDIFNRAYNYKHVILCARVVQQKYLKFHDSHGLTCTFSIYAQTESINLYKSFCDKCKNLQSM